MHRTTTSAVLLIMLGTLFAMVPACATVPAGPTATTPPVRPSSTATTPAVRLSGELVQIADQRGPVFTAAILLDGMLVPIKADRVKDVISGSTVTLDVAIPEDVRVAAAANRTLTTLGVDGKEIRVPLRSSDLAAASDGSPEGLTSAIGKATVAVALAPGTPPLEVIKVVTAGSTRPGFERRSPAPALLE